MNVLCCRRLYCTQYRGRARNLDSTRVWHHTEIKSAFALFSPLSISKLGCKFVALRTNRRNLSRPW